MPSESVSSVPTSPVVHPPHKYKFQQERLPIKKWDSAIKEGNELLRATYTQIDKMREIANDGGYIFSELAGDLITQTDDLRQHFCLLEKRRHSFGVMKYIRFGNAGRMTLEQCTRTLLSAQTASDTMLRMAQATQNSLDPQSRSNQSPDRAGDNDDRDFVSTKSTLSRSNAADYSPPSSHRPIRINAGHVTLNFYDCHTTIRGLAFTGTDANGFTLNCHTTESRGSMHNNMQFPPTSASEAPAPESTTPGSGI